MRRYVVHDLVGGLREQIDDLSELPPFLEWAEAEYPGISDELMVRTFYDGREVAPSRWALEVVATLREPTQALVRVGRWRTEQALRLQRFGTGWPTLAAFSRQQTAATETLVPPATGSSEAALQRPHAMAS